MPPWKDDPAQVPGDYKQQYMSDFSVGRKAVWYVCTLFSSVTGYAYYAFPTAYWMISLPPGFMLLLACFELLRYRRNRRRTRMDAENCYNHADRPNE